MAYVSFQRSSGPWRERLLAELKCTNNVSDHAAGIHQSSLKKVTVPAASPCARMLADRCRSQTRLYHVHPALYSALDIYRSRAVVDGFACQCIHNFNRVAAVLTPSSPTGPRACVLPVLTPTSVPKPYLNPSANLVLALT